MKERTTPPTTEESFADASNREIAAALDLAAESAPDHLKTRPTLWREAAKRLRAQALPTPLSVGSLRSTMTMAVKDWSVDRRDAWLYGVIVGWGDALDEVCARHEWPATERDRLRELNEEFNRLVDFSVPMPIPDPKT